MTKSSIKRVRSNQTGSMLILVCVTMALLAAGLLIAASFAGVYFAHNRLQTSADEIALTGARKLNEFNRLGQMNDLIARSRQMVFSVNQQYQQLNGGDPIQAKFAKQLDDEAKTGAIQLETERHQLAVLAEAEAKTAMQSKFDQIKNTYAMTLPWMTVGAPQIVSSETGKIAGMTTSNSLELLAFSDLVAKEKNDVVTGLPVNLYRPENDAQLQDDMTLHFRFSPLPAAVSKSIAPAREVLPENFQPSVADYAPCATKVEIALNVATGMGPHAQSSFKVASAASASGGGLFQ